MAKDYGEKSGGNVNYYLCEVKEPKRPEIKPYTAECEDIIQALGMTFSEGCAFKAIWRSCAERELGLAKLGGDAIYDAEKTVHYGNLMIKERRMRARTTELKRPPLGLTPKYICDETRIAEILAAIERYNEAGKAVPGEWNLELSALLNARPMTLSSGTGVVSILDNDIGITYAGNLGTVANTHLDHQGGSGSAPNNQGGVGSAMVSSGQGHNVYGGGTSSVSGNGGAGGGGPGAGHGGAGSTGGASGNL